jgi:predicted ABC-type exoprotein transport system permease subunit
MPETAARQALVASTIALLATVACIAMFLPPLVQHTTASVLRIVLLGLGILVGLFAHWIYLGRAASRLGRSVLGWVLLAVLLFPLGGAAALMLLSSSADAGEPTPNHG